VLASLALLSGTAIAQTGNGAMSGAHYNLNIIGVNDCTRSDPASENGHVIFVKIQGGNKIQLFESFDQSFWVEDSIACDGSPAKFHLPANYTCNTYDDAGACTDYTLFTEYSVWVRALGQPGGGATMTTCAYDDTGDKVCSTDSVIGDKVGDPLFRNGGQTKFQNVTSQLTSLYVDLDGDGTLERIPLFSDLLQDYFWQYDNHGLRLAQLRFYPL